MNNTWFVSDLHFQHRRIVEYTNRGQETTQEDHDRWLTKIWNAQVKPGDLVYHLGDLSFSKDVQETAFWLQQLNGQIHLIKGNHDHSDTFFKLKEMLPNKIVSISHYKEIRVKLLDGTKQDVVLFHFPIGSWHKQSRGSWHLHGHCFDEDTEVLTESGFKKRTEIAADDKIATMNTTTGFVEYQSYTQKHEYQISDTLYKYEGKSLDFVFTTKHRVYTKPSKNSALVENTVDSIRGNHSFPVSAENNKNDYPISDLLLRLYVQITTDGSFENNNLVRFHLKKQRKINRLVNLLDNLNISYSNNIQKSGNTKINFRLPDELSSFEIKPLDRNLVMNLSSRQVKILLEEYRVTDGCSTGKNSIQISTSKECEANLLQEILVTSGFCCNLLKRQREKYTNYILSVNTRKESLVNTKQFTKEYYEGIVWCLTVPNSTLIIRRNGKVHVTGNSHGNYKDSRGKMLDVGLDNAYNLYFSHRLFSVNDVEIYMNTVEQHIADEHRGNRIEL